MKTLINPERNPRKIAKFLASQIRPKPKMKMLDYANEHGYITSSVEGRMKWITRPYQEFWFHAVDDPRVECIVCMKPSRVGWSAYVKLVVQYFVDWKRSKIMIIQPTEKEAIDYAAEDIDTMFDEKNGVPRLKGLLGSRKTRAGFKVTALFKQLTNGALIHLVNAATPRSARRVRRNPILAEEPAAYDSPEGDTLENFFQRAGDYPDPFYTIGGTPIFPNDYMDQCFKKGDQQHRYYPCPHCSHYQQLAWEQFVLEGEHEGKFECENCKTPIEYSSLRWMDRHAGWACPFGLDRSKQVLRDGFPAWWSQQVGPGMSYHRAASWPELVARYKNAAAQLKLGNPDPMQTFHNTDRGRPWEDSIASKLTAEGLSRRRQDTTAGNSYPCGADISTGKPFPIPSNVLAITLGVDVQGGGGSEGERLAVMVWGWGRGEEAWHLGWFEIDGDPQRTETLDQLDHWSSYGWEREDGASIPMSLGAIDMGGHASEEIKRWCSTRVGRWIPVKGAPGAGPKRPPLLGRATALVFNRKNKAMMKVGRDAMLYPVGYEASIFWLQGALRIEKPGPRYMHLGMAAEDQMLAELFPWKRVPKGRRASANAPMVWHLPAGSHDEAGDATRYAYAALKVVERRYGQGTMWDQLEAQALARRRGVAQPEPAQPRPKPAADWLNRGGLADRRRNWLK